MADRFDADSDKAPSIHEGLSPTVVVGLDGALSPEDDAPDDASVNHHGSASSLHLPEPERESVGVYLMSFLVILSGLALLCLLMMSLRGQKGLSVMLSNMMGGSYVPHKKHAS
ncbi:hypothetical protein MRX96_038875 [Rhipicephalus microplus]